MNTATERRGPDPTPRTSTRTTKALAALAATAALLTGGAVATAAPAEALSSWSSIRTMYDCSGNGCLTVNYRIDVSDYTGVKLESVKISAAGGPLNFAGIDGFGLSCWNDNNVIKWQKSGGETDLDKGQAKSWFPDQTWGDTTKLACGWSWRENYYVGGSINQCAKVMWIKNEGESTGGC